MADAVVESAQRACGWLLIAGGVLAIAGAFCPPYRQWSAPPAEALRVIAAHPMGWRLIHAGFLSGTIVSAIGLASFAVQLRGTPGQLQALSVAVAYGLAAAVWSVNIAVRLTVTPWAAEQLLMSGEIPPSYAPWKAFNGVLFGLFGALAYGAVAGLGWAVLRSGVAPAWAGWLFVAWGLSAGFVVGATVPFIAYVPFVVLGVLLLRAT